MKDGTWMDCIKCACKSSLSLLVLTAGAWIAQADDGDVVVTAPAAPAKLTLEQAVQIGLERQPAVTGARASRNAAIAQKESADSPLSLFSGPIIHVRRKQAELGVAIAQSGLDQAELETINAVTRTYLTVLFASEQLKVAKDSVDRFKALHEVAEKMVREGTSKEITTADVERIGTYRLLAESKHAEASAGIVRAKAALREAMGLPQDTPIDLSEDKLAHNPMKISCDCAVKVALQHRPELIQAILASELASLEVRAQGLTLRPYAKTFGATGDVHAKILPATVIDGDYRPGALGPEMPPYLAGSHSSRKERAGHLADRASSVADKARGLVALEVEETCQRLVEQTEQVRVLTQASKKATKLADDAEKAFRADQISAEKMLTAQVIDAQTRAQLNEALYRHGVAQASLHRATGGRFWECVDKEHGEAKPAH